MKHMSIALGCALAIATTQLSTSVLAADPPVKTVAQEKAKPLTPAQLRDQVKENNKKIKRLFLDLYYTCKDGRKLGEKLPPKALGIVEDILKYMKIPENEGRPTECTLSSAHRRIGESLSTPLNLRLIDEARKHLDEALRLATTPEEKAEARYSIAVLAIQTAQDDAIETSKKEIMTILEGKDLPAKRRLDLLKSTIFNELLPDLDFRTVGWKIAEPDPDAHYTFYYNAIILTEDMFRWYAKNSTRKLEDRYSKESKVEICDRAIKDPAVRNKNFFLEKEANILLEMRRPEQAEQLLLENIATTNAAVQYEIGLMLGNLYVKMADRYYDVPYKPILEKAITAYTIAKLANPKRSRPSMKIAEAALQMNEFDRAIVACKDYIRLELRGTNRWASAHLGDAYYGIHDWENAALCYKEQKQYLFLPSLLKYCQSLYALGRYEETLENLKLYEKKGWSPQKDEARFLMKKVKEKIRETSAKE